MTMSNFRAFGYGFAVIQVTLFLIIFQELYELGAITEAQAEDTAFVLSIVTLLILATAISDILKLLLDRSRRPYPTRVVVIPLGLSLLLAYGLYIEAPSGMEPHAMVLGAILGVLATGEYILAADPVYKQVVRLELWLEERGIE